MRNTKWCNVRGCGVVLLQLPVYSYNSVLLSTLSCSVLHSLPGVCVAFDISLPFQLKQSEGLHTVICPSLRIAKPQKVTCFLFTVADSGSWMCLCEMYTNAATINPCPTRVCQADLLVHAKTNANIYLPNSENSNVRNLPTRSSTVQANGRSSSFSSVLLHSLPISLSSLFFSWDYVYHFLFQLLPITVAAQCEAWTVFARSNAEIVGSNSTQRMNVVVPLFCVCVVLRAGNGFATGRSPVQGVQQRSVEPQIDR
jgi:hypothetical protein